MYQFIDVTYCTSVYVYRIYTKLKQKQFVSRNKKIDAGH